MPFSKKVRLRVARLKRRKRRSVIPKSLGLIGFPKSRIVKMRYVQSNLQTCTAGAISTITWSANSIFDPYVPAGGHQPLGHDQWQTYYKSYVVLGSKINCRFSFASGTVPIEVGVIAHTASSLTTTSYEQIQEQGKSKSTTLTASTANPAKNVFKTFSAKQWFNVKDVQDNTARIGGAFGAVPAEQAYFISYVQSQDLSGTVSARVIVTIDYIVLVSEPKELNVS